jgi:hypothetical protein
MGAMKQMSGMYLSWHPCNLAQLGSSLLALRDAARSVSGSSDAPKKPISDILQVHLVTVKVGVVRRGATDISMTTNSDGINGAYTERFSRKA